jgi:hypothetical protein
VLVILECFIVRLTKKNVAFLGGLGMFELTLCFAGLKA